MSRQQEIRAKAIVAIAESSGVNISVLEDPDVRRYLTLQEDDRMIVQMTMLWDKGNGLAPLVAREQSRYGAM